MAISKNHLTDTYTGVTENTAGRDGSSLDTGDLLRTFDFSEKVYKLTPQVDPLFTFVSKLKKQTTPDPQFKYAEERDVTHMRYGYILGALAGTGNGTTLSNYEFCGIDSNGSTNGCMDKNTAGDAYTLVVGADFKWSGNIASVYGNSNNNVAIGDSGTCPKHFLAGQMLKVPLKSSASNSAAGNGSPTTYQTVRITKVTESGNYTYLEVKVVGVAESSQLPVYFTTYNPLGGGNTTDADEARTDSTMIDQVSLSTNMYSMDGNTLASLRSLVIGTSFAMGTSGPESFVNQPISTGYGYTQIFKTSLKMDNTSRATEYKFKKDSWLYNWKKKMQLHKYDIAHTGLFGVPYDDTSNDRLYTEGVINYIAKYGNQFTLDFDSKGAEDFMDDLQIFLDPRYNNAKPTIFFMDTSTWAWTNKLSGLATNSIGDLNSAANNTPYNYNFQSLGMKEFFGVNANIVSTPAGTIKLVKNTHLDGTDIGILGVNLNNAKYRPLNGNGINRDTKIYPAVKALEHTGDDYREDQILTETGFEWSIPETHAIWYKAGSNV